MSVPPRPRRVLEVGEIALPFTHVLACDYSGHGGWGVVMNGEVWSGPLPPRQPLGEVHALHRALTLLPDGASAQVYLDAECVLHELTRTKPHGPALDVLEDAQRRGLSLRLEFVPRTHPRMREADAASRQSTSHAA